MNSDLAQGRLQDQYEKESVDGKLNMLSRFSAEGLWTHRKARLFVCAIARTAMCLFNLKDAAAMFISVAESCAERAEEDSAKATRHAFRRMTDYRLSAEVELRAATFTGTQPKVDALALAVAALEHPRPYPQYLVVPFRAWCAATEAGILLGMHGFDALWDIMGQPFLHCEVYTSPTGNPLIGQLAEAAYDAPDPHTGRLDNDRLCVLADALEEDGCRCADTLAHLRLPGPHYKGCTGLDAVAHWGG